MNETSRLVGTLTLVAAVAGLCIAVAAAVTREPIERATAEAFRNALLEVLPPDSDEPERHDLKDDDGADVFEYYKAGAAMAIEVSSPNGYAGTIRMLVGFDGQGNVQGYTVLEHRETPGLGANIATQFRERIVGRPATKTDWRVTRDGGDIDALTAATISSRAVCEAVADAVARRDRVLAADR